MNKNFEKGYYAEVQTYEGDFDQIYRAIVYLGNDEKRAKTILNVTSTFFGENGKYNNYIGSEKHALDEITDLYPELEDYVEEMVDNFHLPGLDFVTFRTISDIRTFYVEKTISFPQWSK